MPHMPNIKYNLIKRWILITLSMFVFILFTITILLNYYKDDIGREILLRVNKTQKGELAFENISVNPFVHFPNVSLALSDVDYYEYSEDERLVDSIPIIELEKLFIAFNVIELIKGNVTASKILFNNGKVNLVTYVDSSLNLINAFNPEWDSLQNNEDTLQEISSDFELNLEKIILKNISITHNKLSTKSYSVYNIHSLDASLNYLPDTIKCQVNSNIAIETAKLNNGLVLNNKNIKLETSLVYHRNARKVIIEPSSFSFEGASFSTQGYMNLSNDGFIDMVVKGNDEDFSILNLFLTNTAVKNIEQGNLSFNGSVVGMLFEGIPQIECSFGIVDVEIQIPNTNHSISKLNLIGSFQSGKEKDFSKAKLNFEEIKAQLPGGSLNGTFSVMNFKTPTIDVNYNMKADINGFHNIFDFGLVDSLTGSLAIDVEFNGQYDPIKNHFIEHKNNSTIRFNNISFAVPEVTRIHDIDGLIRFNADSLHFEEFGLEIGTSDFNINGSLINILYVLFDVDKKIDGDLHIVSNTYDFPDFFKHDRRIVNNFPYRIKDIVLNVGVTTSTKDLSNFITSPRIVFDIHHLNAEIEDFLSPVSINSGVFTLGDKDSALNLDFVDFDIIMASGKLFANVVYNSPPADPDWIKIDLNAKDLNPQKTFVHPFTDSIPNSLVGELGGSLHLELVLSMDTIDFDNLNFTAYNLNFINSTDTFDLSQLKLNAIDVDYDLTSSSNIMENLNCELGLTIKKLYSKSLKVDELTYDIKVEKGTYKIRPINSQFFNQKGEGLYVLKPFAEKPIFDIKYKVLGFDVAKLFHTFMEDTVLTGKMDLDLAFTFAGNDWKEIKQTLDGRLLINGKDLTLYGIDLDKVIDRFKRSQHFTFVDVGAVLLMGPAGILVTKGSDIASMIVLNHGESCHVVELSSDWEVDDGMVNLVDVAFTTNENRLAARGGISLITDRLNIDIALLNEKGCSLYSQSITGDLHEPDMGKVKVMKSLLAPVTNLVKVECDVFYNGKVKQPTIILN